MTLTAYDYDKQTWVRGEAARPLLIQQAEETIAALQQGGYRRMMGYSDSQAARLLANARETLDGLQLEREQ